MTQKLYRIYNEMGDGPPVYTSNQDSAASGVIKGYHVSVSDVDFKDIDVEYTIITKDRT
jgi:hypothetical protein